MFPETITINVTQADLDNGSRRGEQDDDIMLALRRDYPEFEPSQVGGGNSGIRLSRDGLVGWYPKTPEYVHLINTIDLTGGQPQPAELIMNLAEVHPG